MSNTIPNFNAMSTAEIGQWIVSNPSNAEGVKQAAVALGVVTAEDLQGVSGGAVGSTSGPSLPPPSGSLDFSGAKDVFAQFEELLILFQQMSSENKKISREAANALLEKAAQALLDAAGKKDDAAGKMLTMAIVALVITVVGVALSVLLAPLSAGVGSAVKSAAEGVKQGIKEGVKAALKAIINFIKVGLQATFSNPQVAQGIFSGISQSMSSFGQTMSLTDQAEGDRFAATAQTTQSEQKKSEDRVADFREAMKKMNELLRTLYDAQTKAEEAAARA